MSLTPDVRTKLIEICGAKKFGRWWTWEKPVLGHCIGPSSPDAFDDFYDRLDALRVLFRETLNARSDQELLRFQESNSVGGGFGHDWFDGFLQPEIRNVTSNCPVWLAAGFGHPEARADFEYWGQMARYSSHEVLALSVGVKPEFIPDKLTEAPRRSEQSASSAALQFLRKRRVLLEGHFPKTDWGRLSVRPSWVKKLVDEIALEVHPEFYRQLELRETRSVTPPKAAAPLSDHERQSFLKLIAAMAAEQYGFDPRVSRNTATAAIEADLHATGLDLDRKTILKHLREASDLVDPSYWAQG